MKAWVVRLEPLPGDTAERWHSWCQPEPGGPIVRGRGASKAEAQDDLRFAVERLEWPPVPEEWEL